MKKIISTVLLCAMLLITLASCSSGFDYVKSDLKKYVTVGEYKGISVTADDIAAITDEAVQDVIDALLDEHKTEKKVTDRAIELTDVIYFTYEGHLINEDGSVNEEKFSGGTITEPTDLLIGSGNMIDGFEEGLVGVVPADTSAENPFALEVTFPADYKSADLAGKDAVFYCVIDYIVDDIIEAGEITEESVLNLTFTAVYEDGTVYEEVDGKTYDLMIDVDEEDDSIPGEVAEALIGKELTGEPLVLDPVEIEHTYTDDNDNETKVIITYNVTVNYIEGTDYEYPELTDEFVTENTDFDTVDAYKADILADLEADRAEQLKKNEINATWTAIVDASEVTKTPSSALKAAREDIENNLYAMYYYYNFNYYYFYYYYYGSYYWTDFSDFLADYYTDYEDYDDGIEADAIKAVKEKLVFYTIVKDLGYDAYTTITEEDYNARIAVYAEDIVTEAEKAEQSVDEYIKENYADYYEEGYTTAETLIVALYGGEDVVREAMLWDYVMEELAEAATITLTPAAETEETTEE